MPPQSSPTTPDSPPSSTASNNGNRGNFMSATGSPPIILAFLAIGIFSAAMIAVFGWRRVQNPRGIRWQGGRHFIDRLDFTGPSLPPVVFGERPPLWETWMDRTSGGKGKDTVGVGYANWDCIVPLSVASSTSKQTQNTLQSQTSSSTRGNSGSAVVMYDMGSMRSDPPSSESNRNRNGSRPRRQGVRGFIPPRFLRHIGGGDGNTAVPSASTTRSPNSNGVNEEKEEIQIAVIIKLPSPSSSHHYHYSRNSEPETLVDNHHDSNLDGGHDEKEEITNYCIGVHTCALPVSANPAAIKLGGESPRAKGGEKVDCR